MKKIISLILALTCAFALFSCGEDALDPFSKIASMYNTIAPSKVVTKTTQTFGNYTLESSSTLKVGSVDGFSAAVYEYSRQQLRDIDSGSDVEILSPIETVTGKLEYHADLGLRENGGNWDVSGEDFTPETGAIALNITKATVRDFADDAKAKTATFTVTADNTEAVFGYEIPADVAVVIAYSGADVTSVSLSYTLINEDNDDHPEIAVTVVAEYSYESQVITIE